LNKAAELLVIALLVPTILVTCILLMPIVVVAVGAWMGYRVATRAAWWKRFLVAVNTPALLLPR
jgi:hypothetical protein